MEFMLTTLLLPVAHTTKWQAANEKLKKLYKWGKWETDTFTLCGVRYHQKRDLSVQMDQQELTRKMTTTDFNLPKNLYRTNGKNKLDQMGIKSLRGINGSLQWLATNSRIDLSAKVSLSASETANPTIESLHKANKIIRQAQRGDTLPITSMPFL